MTSARYQDDVMPEASESKEDPSLRSTQTVLLSSSASEQMSAEVDVFASQDTKTMVRQRTPRPNPKRVTGIHRDIRATSTDAERLTVPAPDYDDPKEDTPGESENPQREFDEDLIEDAYED